MAASSPAKSNGAAAESIAAAATPPSSNASKSLRGLNKPKCIKCGNVARSRCPYQSCKNCCAKAQNPCHIHVLKGNSSLPDKPPSSGSPLLDQQSADISHSGNSHRLRHLSNNFAQFSNLQTPFRARKPLTRKDAQVINEWRFLKLKEFKEGNIKAESEAFDRYMQNVSLLEDVFSVKSVQDENPSSEVEESTEKMIDGLKLKLGSDPVRTDNLRKRVQQIVDNGLRKLGKFELTDVSSGNVASDAEGLVGRKSKKVTALSDLSDKLNKARNEEDLKACREMASQIFEWNNSKMGQTGPALDSCIEKKSSFFPPKWVNPGTVEQEALCRIDAQFSALEEIEDL